MKKILNIITSPRLEASNSNKLGNALVERLIAEYPGSLVITRNLTEGDLPHLSAAHLDAFFTPLENHSLLHKQSTSLSDELINEIFSVDIIVINVAMWNFSIPSSLKAWIDQIARAGITFGFSENGPVGLISDKKVYLAIATGGIYTDISNSTGNFVEPYLKFVLAFLGLTDLTTYRVEGLSVPNLRDGAFEKALQSIDNSLKIQQHA